MTTQVAVAADWVYWKIYVGEAVGAMDYLVTTAFPQALETEPFQKWFYIRYADEGGFHLRARFLPVQNSAEKRSHMRRLFERALKVLPRFAGLEYRPMVVPDHLSGVGKPSTTRAFVEAAEYEPEFHKFGGPAGMAIAESLFEASSNLAIAVLKDELAGLYSRKSAAPCLMHSVRKAFPPGPSEQAFWKSYSLYWLGSSSAVADEWRGRFERKTSTLVSSGSNVVEPRQNLHPDLASHLERWDEALALCARRYAEEKSHTATGAMLCFQFLHLMNNRLGLNVLEEAYLATLLEHSTKQRAAAA